MKWSDKTAWNDYFNAELQSGGVPAWAFYAEEMVLQGLPVALE